ncbi:MAG TPA: response regulator [Verrucomicrobiae bacterium]
MKRILVIEDDEAVRGLIVETIGLKDWEALAAADGEAGVQAAQRELPDLILCDIQMPKMDGYAVLEAIRENKSTASIPFVFLTGLGDKLTMRKGMESGADDYLVKPFTVQELIAAIEARLQKQAAVRESAETRLNELRESLTFALPHELVTPLNTILGFSSLMIESPEISREETKEYAALVHQAGERLKKLVEKFLIYAQVELTTADREAQSAVRAPHLTSDTISAVAGRVAREFNRGKDLQLTLAPVEHRISASHLERIARELVENAFKFSEVDSKVEVKTARNEEMFVLEVSDRGRGLSAEQIQRVGTAIQFDRRLHEQQGTGLGLAIARRLTEFYHGKMEVRSKQGESTSVTVAIPA